MRPVQFVTQCVTNWKRLIKHPHIAQIAGFKTPAKLLRQAFGQLRHQARAIRCARLALLLEIHDMAANFPTGMNQDRIHRTQRLRARLHDQFAQAAQQRPERDGFRLGGRNFVNRVHAMVFICVGLAMLRLMRISALRPLHW